MQSFQFYGIANKPNSLDFDHLYYRASLPVYLLVYNNALTGLSFDCFYSEFFFFPETSSKDTPI